MIALMRGVDFKGKYTGGGKSTEDNLARERGRWREILTVLICFIV